MATHVGRAGTQARKTGPSSATYLILGAFTLAIVAAVIAVGALARGGSNAGAAIVVPAARPASVQQNGYTYGDPNAPVTIDEYVDFQCPFCQAAVLNVLPAIEEQYIETGVAKLVAHPIAILGTESTQAAAAAEAANQQGKFWAFFDTLYANQGAENSGAFSAARLSAMAQALGLDTRAFDSALKSGQYVQQVTQATTLAEASGVSSTPTILVNGARVSPSVDALSAAIEAVKTQ